MEEIQKHVCIKCQHFKQVNPRSLLPPADALGWCKKIHWPFYWIVSKEIPITECTFFEQKQ